MNDLVFAEAYARYERELIAAHRRIEELERENSLLRLRYATLLDTRADLFLTLPQACHILREHLNGGYQKTLAAKIGVSTVFLNETLNGKRHLTDKILAYLNLKRIVVYQVRKS